MEESGAVIQKVQMLYGAPNLINEPLQKGYAIKWVDSILLLLKVQEFKEIWRKVW